MLNKVQKFITDNNLFTKEDKLLLGLSGGRDSVVLLHVLLKLNYHVTVAHCNFNLRGEESENETLFVQRLCDRWKVKYHVKYFDTTKVKDELKISTQLAARELRYSWFEDLRRVENRNKILTAHHLDDQVETFFINLSRGTGLKGLLGIPCELDNVVRPLLSVSRNEVTAYANENDLQYKDDSSNESDDYLRNDIRHHVVPKFTSVNPSFLTSFNRTITHLDDVQQFWEKSYKSWLLDWEGDSDVHFKIEEILDKGNKSFLTHFLHERGFSYGVLEDLLSENTERTSGSLFYSNTHQLLYNRGEWIFGIKTKMSIADKYFLNDSDLPISLMMKNKVYNKSSAIPSSNQVIWIDKDHVQGELFIRHWEQGDVFYPFGMSQKKKLSDYFIDNKFSRRDKEKIWLLCDEKSIIWIIGSRLDNRYRLTDSTDEILEVEVNLSK